MRVPIRKPGKYTHLKPDLNVTPAKLEEMKEKLASLKKKQPALAEEVHRLAQLGDLSENAGYQIAKGRLRGVNSEISKLEDRIGRAIVIDSKPGANSIELGHTVTIETTGKQFVFTILGSTETDPGKNIISHSSPLGEALMSRTVGDVVNVKLRDREVEYKILKIE